MNQNNTLSNKKIKNNSKDTNSLNSSNYDSHISLKLNSSNSYSNIDEEIIKLIETDINKYKEFFNINTVFLTFISGQIFQTFFQKHQNRT